MIDGAGAVSHYFALPSGSRLYEFEIESLLGHGGFGITYRAVDTLLEETVAIKEYLPNEVAIRISDSTVRAKSQQQLPDFDAGLKSFLAEARVMARFRHPRIVHVRRFFELHGTGYIVLDYERGKTLSERLGEGTIPEAELRSILSGVLDGLEVIHDRAILHRDLKPNNVMLREDGAPVIIDFGAARDFQARHSRSITAIATAGYAPPEQYGIDGQQGPWSDLYALGAIAYRSVSGAPPADSLRRMRNDPLVPAVVAGAGKYDESLLRTIDWMLKIDEADRPASVAQVRDALRGKTIPEASRQPDSQTPDQAQVPATTRAPSRRGRAAAIAVSLLILAGLAGAGSYAFFVNYQAKRQAIQQSDLAAKQQAKQQSDLQPKQQAERQVQEANERQKLLADQLASAGTDQSKLEQFLAACGSDCPDAFRTQAQARIDTIKQQRQAELNRQDEETYRAARGDLAKLRAYDAGCTQCTFRDAARSEIASIEERQQREARRIRFLDRLKQAGNDPSSLQNLLVDCGDNCPSDVIAQVRDKINNVSSQRAAAVAECDRLASAPFDTTRPSGVVGVSFGDLNAAQAVPACREAFQIEPQNVRLAFQLGRALEKMGGDKTESFALYKQAAEGGSAVAMNNLGNSYESGSGVRQDYAQARQYYERAAATGLSSAMTNLGTLYQDSEGVAKDYTQARQWYEKAAAAGEPVAMANLGNFYVNGLGTAKDYVAARAWYEKAVAAGIPAGMTGLGVLYENGWSVTKDYTKARDWYQKAADHGEATAMVSLGNLYVNGLGTAKDYGAARAWYEKAAAAGIPGGMTGLGVLYENGWSVTKDYTKARDWYQKSADHGEGPAMVGLGNVYVNGLGTAKDYGAARAWYEKAAAAGIPGGMTGLGVLYEHGWGVTKDFAQARDWYQKAADAGEPTAMKNLGFLYQNGWSVTKDYAQARQLYERAAALGEITAMANVGIMYANGTGVAKNYAQARQWLEKAAVAGQPEAMGTLGALYANGWGGPKSRALALEWTEKAAAAGNETARRNLQIIRKMR